MWGVEQLYALVKIWGKGVRPVLNSDDRFAFLEVTRARVCCRIGGDVQVGQELVAFSIGFLYASADESEDVSIARCRMPRGAKPSDSLPAEQQWISRALKKRFVERRGDVYI